MFYRCRKKDQAGRTTYTGSSIRNLERYSGLTRETIKTCLGTLLEYNLVKQASSIWKLNKLGLSEHPEWFSYRTETIAFANLNYQYFLQPEKDSPFSIRDALIYLAQWKEPKVNNSCLAARFKISRATVKRFKQKRVNYTPDWWQDIKHKAKKIKPVAKNDYLEKFSGGEKLLVKSMQNDTFTQTEIDRCLSRIRAGRSDDSYFNQVATLNGTGDNSYANLMACHRRSEDASNGLGLLIARNAL